MTLADLIEAAPELAPEDRYELANQLLASVEAPSDQGAVDAAWNAEFRSRIADVESGKIELVDHSETVAIARAALAEQRANRAE